MERAELTSGSVALRGSGAIHRILSALGAFFLGIEPEGKRVRRVAENWWDREDDEEERAVVRKEVSEPLLRRGHQAELFDAAGRGLARTEVSVRSRAAGTARVVATTRPAVPVRVAAVAKTAKAARGSVARQLVMSQSISSGREESHWFSVPQRVLLPHFQLFEGSDAVTEEGGHFRVGRPVMKTQRGQVWFV